jgi:hypothetical protein
MPDDHQAPQTTNDNNGAFGTTNKLDTSTTASNAKDQAFPDLVGEGKRYATLEDLAKGKQEADAFIEQLKLENAQMREDLSKRPTLDDIQDIMKLQNENRGEPASEFNEEALTNIVTSQLSALKEQERAQSNVQAASDKMVELYGDKAAEQVQAKANELGVTVEYLQGVAAKNPAIFYATMGVSDTKAATNAGNQTAQGDSNTAQFNTNTVGTKEGTWSYYEKMRREDSKKYFSPKVQNEMFKARKEMGADFYK